MKRIQYIAIYGGLIIGLMGCKKEVADPDSSNPNVLPPLTHEGKNTFGCKVNGEVWVAYAPFTVGGPMAMEGNFSDVSGNFNLRGLNKERNQSIHLWLSGLFDVEVYEIEVDGYDINDLRGFRNSSENNGCLGEANYNQDLLRELFIVFLDKNNRIISGTFEMDLVNPSCPGDTVKIREGRFDWRY
ncbi:hypothetical protein GCM10009118_13410 [Wandonia haliotis]|uniref:Lipoprotein n=1 Tax=Wandonia haliotis TaxID=574963 RepID=A0ABN1MNV0_9FLAO